MIECVHARNFFFCAYGRLYGSSVHCDTLYCHDQYGIITELSDS
jgi:hypothetical protein